MGQEALKSFGQHSEFEIMNEMFWWIVVTA